MTAGMLKAVISPAARELAAPMAPAERPLLTAIS